MSRHWLRHRVLAGVVAALAATFAATTARAAGDLQSELSAVEGVSAFDAGQRVTVQLSFRNTSDQDMYVLAYETPLRGFERDLFVVERDGERIPYLGIVAFRSGPRAEDWIHIAPGAELSQVVDISSAYDTRRGGTYSVRYNAFQQVQRGVDRSRLPLGEQRSGRGFAGQSVRSGPVDVSVSASSSADREVEPAAAPAASGDVGTMGTFGCQSPSTISSAQSAARSRALRARNAASSFNTWYKTWFGNTSSSVSTVRGRFSNAYSRLGQNVDYYCGSYAPHCSAGVVAYTYKTTTNRMYLCSAFWSYSNKGHVVGHEAYHWNTVAGADDVTYGYSQCQNLARTRPYDALRNADNYAYAADYAP